MHFLEDNLFRCCILLRHIIPLCWVSPLGRFCGFVFYTLLGSWRNRSIAQLQTVFPDKSPRELRRLLREVTCNGGKVVLEQLMAGEKIIQSYFEEVQGFEEADRTLQEMLGRGRGVILVGTHMNNWEALLGMGAHHLATQHGHELNVLVNRMPTPYLDKVITDIRRRVLRCNLIYTKQALYHVEKVFNRKGAVVFGLDVDAGHHGIFVPFMNRPISMTPAPAFYALKNKAPIGFFVMYQDRDGSLRVQLEEVRYEPTGNTREDAHRLTAKLASRIEYWVRQYPEQWFGWIQKTWKTRPLEELSAQLAKQPARVDLLNEVGAFYLGRKKVSKAQDTFQKVLETDPNCHLAHLELGGLFSQKEKVEEALYHLFRALETHPKDQRTWKYLGIFFLKRGLYPTALQYFNRALRMKYDDPESCLGKGQCLERLGKLKEAIRAYTKGLRINYDYGPLHLAMAKIYAARPDCKEHLEKHLLAMRKLHVVPDKELLDISVHEVRK